jgi:hypothetical protein
MTPCLHGASCADQSLADALDRSERIVARECPARITIRERLEIKCGSDAAITRSSSSLPFAASAKAGRKGQASGFGAQLSAGQIASEIRLGRPRRIGIFSRVPLEVFSTNHFRPAVRILHIRHGCCPRRREDIFILDSELELQVFT